MSKSKLNNNNNSNQLPVQLSAQPVQIGNNENIIFEDKYKTGISWIILFMKYFRIIY